jgi:hypothetical protein
MYRSTFSWPRHTSWRWVVSFTPQPLYPRERGPGTHWIADWVDPRAFLDDVEERQFLNLPGLELRLRGCPARSQSLYRLSYRGSLLQNIPWVYVVKRFLSLVWVVWVLFGVATASSRSAWWMTFTPVFCKFTSFPVRECDCSWKHPAVFKWTVP